MKHSTMNEFYKNNIRIPVITCLIILVTALHYFTQQSETLLHVIFREFYFLPIIMAGFFYGLRGGLIASVFVTLLYLPYIVYHLDGFSSHDLGNFLQIILFTCSGGLTGWLRDREKALEAGRRKSESLAVMGKAVSCIAHDMKTPLIVSGGLIQQVRRKITDTSIADKLDYAYEQIHRLEIMTGDMLAFAKPLELELQQGEIGQLIDEVVRVTSEKACRRSITITSILEKETLTAEYDHQRLHQALVNLVNNAIEACPDGSEVTLRCQKHENQIMIEVADQGCGIPEAISDNIFAPFVTTKKEGTGLGLSIVKKIIDAHKGFIAVIKNSKNGVIFQVTIPLKIAGGSCSKMN